MKRLQGTLSRLVFLIITLLSFQFVQAQDLAKGEKIFKDNCSACHALGSQLVGPDLTGVKTRWKDEKKLIAFVHNSQAVITSGDAYAKALFEKFNGIVMPPQALSDEEVLDVLSYVNLGGKTAAGPVVDGSGGGPSESFAPIPADTKAIRWVFYGIIALIIIVLFLVNRLVNQLNRRENEDHKPPTHKGSDLIKKINPYIFLAFGFAFFGFIIFEYFNDIKHLRPEAASDDGIEIDRLFNITLWITLIVFIVTHVMLFYYGFRYRSNKKRKGYYYPHNNLVEFIWTTVPAVTLAILVLIGFKTWNKVTGVPTGDVQEVEIYAKQFSWTFRYPGPDGKLGKTDFRKIDPASNPLGIDFDDPASHDDYVSNDFHVPVNKTIYLKLRSQDVTHDAYLVHFRIQMYVNPGLDNRMQFTPKYTTEEFRERIGKPDFDFELACNQLCGAGHYNMRKILVVEKADKFKAWEKDKKPAYSTFKAAQTTASNNN